MNDISKPDSPPVDGIQNTGIPVAPRIDAAAAGWSGTGLTPTQVSTPPIHIETPATPPADILPNVVLPEAPLASPVVAVSPAPDVVVPVAIPETSQPIIQEIPPLPAPAVIEATPSVAQEVVSVEQIVETEFTPAELAEIEIEAHKLLTEVEALPVMIYTRSLTRAALNHDIFDYHRYYDEKTPSHSNDVLQESMRLIAAERKLGKTITDKQVRMAAVVAMLHDFGMDFTAATPQEARDKHEAKGIEKFQEKFAPINLGENFTPEEILQMENMFPPTQLVADNPDFALMTQMTQHPTEDSLAMITQDADVSNWGMPAEITLQNSRKEYNELRSQDPVGFLRFFTEKILGKHHWKTDAAKKLYGAQHRRNIEFYQELVKKLTANPPTDLKNPF